MHNALPMTSIYDVIIYAYEYEYSCFSLAGAVLAIELLAACQAMEFIRPLTSTAPLEAAYRLVRANIPLVKVLSILNSASFS